MPAPALARWPATNLTNKLARIDRAVFVFLLVALALGVFLLGRGNIMADSVDYYANLQRLSPAGGAPIVHNLHFADQRSPGFSVAALLPHLVLVYLVDPVVGTSMGGAPPSPHAGPPGLIPLQPLLLRQIPFHDFPVPGEIVGSNGSLRLHWRRPATAFCLPVYWPWLPLCDGLILSCPATA